jgi:cell division transport system permease protein
MADLLGKTPAKRSKPNYLFSIISVAMVLFLLGFFGMLLLQTQKLMEVFKERMTVLIEVENGTAPTDIEALLTELKSEDYTKIETVQFISKEEGIKTLQEDFGEEFMTLDLANPLYDVITFNIQAQFLESDLLSQIKKNFKAKAYVHDVYYQDGLIQLLGKNVSKLGWFALACSLLFLVVAITLIHNTIRLALYSNRFLIKNMELVGASWNFISWPYIRKSVIHGLLSAFLAIIALVLLLLLAQREIVELNTLQNLPGTIVLFSGLIILGVFISSMSTWYVINKYLSMRLDDLY